MLRLQCTWGAETNRAILETSINFCNDLIFICSFCWSCAAIKFTYNAPALEFPHELGKQWFLSKTCRNQARQTCHHTGHALPNKNKSFAARTVGGRNIETNRKNIQILRRITLLITRNYIFLMIKNAPDISGKNSFPTRCCFSWDPSLCVWAGSLRTLSMCGIFGCLCVWSLFLSVGS